MSDEQGNELHQYLTFTLGEEIFGFAIDSVREILEETNITRIPRTPNFMRGVINLRGHAVPVVDVRQKFGMSRTVSTENTCIIVIEVEIDGETALIGALADSVQEVMEIGPTEIDEAPRMGTVINPKYIKGMGRSGQKFIILLAIDHLFTVEELTFSGRSDEAEAAAA